MNNTSTDTSFKFLPDQKYYYEVWRGTLQDLDELQTKRAPKTDGTITILNFGKTHPTDWNTARIHVDLIESFLIRGKEEDCLRNGIRQIIVDVLLNTLTSPKDNINIKQQIINKTFALPIHFTLQLFPRSKRRNENQSFLQSLSDFTFVNEYVDPDPKMCPPPCRRKFRYTDSLADEENITFRTVDELKNDINLHKLSWVCSDDYHVVSPVARTVKVIGVNAKIYRYYGKTLSARVNRYILQTIAEFPYCIRKNVCVIPKEYLEKGVGGIYEYISHKQTNSHHNSIENRMIRGNIRDKKQLLSNYIQDIGKVINSLSDTLPQLNRFEVPHIQLEGRWNSTMTKRLTTRLLKDKTRNEILTMTNDSLRQLATNYYLEELNNTVQAITALSKSKE